MVHLIDFRYNKINNLLVLGVVTIRTNIIKSAGIPKKRGGLFGLRQYGYLYLLLLPGILYLIIFKYVPMFGLQLAFKNFKAGLGITGSPWVGLEHFRSLIINRGFVRALINTLSISFLKVICGFPLPIILTLLLNELRWKKYKSALQTVYTFPHFLSWVVLSGMYFNLLAGDGIINQALMLMGHERQSILTSPSSFRWLLVFSAMWKEGGWSTILYLAAIAGIDEAIYEAAKIDGANRLQKIMYITLPGISSMIIVTLILNLSTVLDAGYEQVFNLYNATVYESADIIDTFVYRISFQQTPDFGFSTAVGLFKGVSNMILLLSVNKIVKLFGQKGIV